MLLQWDNIADLVVMPERISQSCFITYAKCEINAEMRIHYQPASEEETCYSGKTWLNLEQLHVCVALSPWTNIIWVQA